MTEVMNYDPNLTYCGRMAKQAVRLVFGKWEYRVAMEVEVGGNCTGLTVIDSAVGAAFEKCWPDPDELPTLTMEDKDGNTLSCDDGEDEGEEWLKKMLLSAEIISIRPDA